MEKYGEEKVNNHYLLLNSAYVVVFIMSLNFRSYSSKYSVVKSHLIFSLSAKNIILFDQVFKGLKRSNWFFSLNQSA